MDQIHAALLHALHPEAEKAIAALEALTEAEWDRVVRQAEKHGLAPLVFHRLEHAAVSSQLPGQVRQILKECYQSSARRNLSLYQELNQVLRALSEAQCPTIVLKGAYLAQAVYKNIALRPMNDLDLLVRQEDLAAAEGKLLALGYRLDENREPGWYKENHFHFRYNRIGAVGTVELHWHIEPPNSPFRVDIEEVWDRSRPTVLAGVPARILSPEDLLLHLCLHTAHTHTFSFFALRSICDIAMLLSFYDDRLAWDVFRQRAAEWGAENCAYLTFCLTDRLLSCSPARWVMRALQPQGFDPRFLSWAEERLLSEFEQPVFLEEMPQMSGRFGNLWSAQGVRGKFSNIINTCFPDRRLIADLYALPADSKRVYLYYLVRLKDLLQRHTATGLQYVQRDLETRAWLDWEGKRAALLQWMRPARSSGSGLDGL
jgi:hypothetical protein